ncbi:winged-helix DNA-binding transcription factor family protein [Prunus dulcis]|uniref:Winged-helix DNA-binding transcription factor family protein n=1 Tax=Prunus dulcis TaxID=3755 RepID=A0A4Y1RJB4_PRUDU|nr:winged-helix DNA-binding transcription factor family protein [Prunus dulcis]
MDPPPPPYPTPHPYPPPIATTATAIVSAGPAITPLATEDQNNIATTHVAANPTPPPNPTSNHPPYTEMIYAAIAALKEKDGSSKRAIAKYIERAYSGLPTTHSALLTHHLKRLKSNGLLVMVKKSYKLPRSDASLPPPNASAAAAAATTALPSAGPSRGRGRPPKTKPILDQPTYFPTIHTHSPAAQFTTTHSHSPAAQFTTIHSHSPAAQLTRTCSRSPAAHYTATPPFSGLPEPTIQQNSQPMLVALGLVDEPAASVKRRPGRPRKVVGVGIGQAGGGPVSAKRGRGRPPGSRLPKKRPGRPPKPKSVSAVVGPNGLVKRGRGRPSKAEPKSVFFPYATNVPIMGAFEQNNVPNVVGPQQSLPRPRGRPKKKDAVAAVRVGGLVPGKRGRPPGLPGMERPKRSTGRPVGRPKKNALVTTTEAPDSQAVANGEFKRKLEYFQFKVGQAVGAIKPYLNNESEVSAIAAIQELEGLAAMDISAPFTFEAPQPPVLQS